MRLRHIHPGRGAKIDIAKGIVAADLRMGPRPHHEARLLAGFPPPGLLPPALEALETFVQQIVVPARDEIGRCLHLAVLALHAIRSPELVEAGVANDFPVEGPFADVVERRQQRQAAVHLIPVDQISRGVLVGALAQPDEIHGVLQLQNAVVAHVAVVVLLVGDGHEGFDKRAAQWCRQDLGETRIGDPKGADSAVAPGLLADPLLRIVPIVSLIDIGTPFVLRLVPAPAVLHEHGVPFRYKAPGPLHVAGMLGAVGRADQQHGEALSCVRSVQGSVEPHPVAHGYRNVELNVHPLRTSCLCRGARWRESAARSGVYGDLR